MREKILEAFNETYDSDCNDFEIIKEEFLQLKYFRHGLNTRV